MKVSIVLCLAVCACANAGVVPLATHLVRTPAHDSAVITSDRVGGNFAYSTKEAHAYAAVSPVVQHVVSPVAVSYSAQPIAYAQPQPFVYAQPQPIAYEQPQQFVYAQPQPFLVPQPIHVAQPGLTVIGADYGHLLGDPIAAAAPATPTAPAAPAAPAAPELAPAAPAPAPAEATPDVESDSVAVDSA